MYTAVDMRGLDVRVYCEEALVGVASGVVV